MKRALSIQSEMAENVARKRPAIIASSQSLQEENDPVVEQEQVNRSDVDMDTNIDDHSMSHASQTSGETGGPNQVNPLDVFEESVRSAAEQEEMSFDAPSSLSSNNSRRSSLNSTSDSTGSDQSSGSGSSSSRRRRRRRSQSTDGDDEQ